MPPTPNSTPGESLWNLITYFPKPFRKDPERSPGWGPGGAVQPGPQVQGPGLQSGLSGRGDSALGAAKLSSGEEGLALPICREPVFPPEGHACCPGTSDLRLCRRRPRHGEEPPDTGLTLPQTHLDQSLSFLGLSFLEKYTFRAT